MFWYVLAIDVVSVFLLKVFGYNAPKDSITMSYSPPPFISLEEGIAFRNTYLN